jgi:hypothetical protein
MLEKGVIPATINYDKPLPEFDLNSSLLTIPVETKPWPGTSLRRISVSFSKVYRVHQNAECYRSTLLVLGEPMPTLCLTMRNLILHQKNLEAEMQTREQDFRRRLVD